MLTVVDTFSRYVPVLDVRYSYRGDDVVGTLDRVCRTAGYPKTIRVDQGSEFISRDMDLWAYQRGGECPVFCVWVIGSMLPERSKDDDDFERTAGRTAEGLQAA